MEFSRYRIIVEGSAGELEKKVNEQLWGGGGWEALGAPFLIPVTGGWGYGYRPPINEEGNASCVSVEFAQALVRPS